MQEQLSRQTLVFLQVILVLLRLEDILANFSNRYTDFFRWSKNNVSYFGVV